MHVFRDLPIKRKLMLVLFSVAAAALGLVAVALFGYERIQFKRTLVTGLQSEAAILADTGATTLDFDDVRAATEVLAAMKIRSDVACAHFFTTNGKVFASYEHPVPGVSLVPPGEPRVGHRFENGAVVVFQPVTLRNELLGVVSVRASLGEVRERLFTYLGILVLVSGVALGATYFLAGRLQRVISEPLLKLRDVTRAVKQAGDYSLRAQASGGDEVGELVGSFNEMLAQIQARDQALTSSEERFQQLATSIQEVFWLTEVDKLAMIYVSPGYATIWGRSCESLHESPMSWAEAIHQDDRIRVRKAAMQKQTVGQYDEEYRILRPDGSMRWVRDRAFPVRDASGRVIRIAGIAKDITERKQAEEERDKFFNLSLDLLCVADTGGYFKRVNPAFTRLLGYSAEEMLSQPIVAFIHPDDRTLTQLELSSLASGKDTVDFINRYACKDGSWRTLSWRVPAAATGTTSIYGVGRDVTEQRLAALKLEESERKFRTLAEFAPIGIFQSAPNGDCQFVNRAWCGITGLTTELALGHGWKTVVHPSDAERVLKEWDETVALGKDSRLEYRMIDAAKRVHWVFGLAICLRDATGGISGFLGTVLDITERKEFEAERQKFVSLVENSRDFVGMAALDGTIIYVNEAGLKLVGLDSWQPAVDKPSSESLQFEDWPIARPETIDSVRTTGYLQGESSLRNVKTGEVISVEYSSFFIKSPGTSEPLCFATVRHDVTERRRLEREVLEIIDRERNRLGQDVHDSICQMLVSAGFTANMLLERLGNQTQEVADDAEKLIQLIEATTEQAYQLSRGSFLATLDAEGLAPMLQDFAANVQKQNSVECKFDYPLPVAISDDTVANHVFRIAQEAVANAIKHGRPRRVEISLTQKERTIYLAVINDGAPFPLGRPRGKGIGILSMQYRTSMIRGVLEYQRGPHGETIVACSFPQTQNQSTAS